MSGDPPVRFEVLGPLQAWHGTEPLRLGPAQQRVVLGVLLLQPNRPVGRGQLIDAVWGDAAPAHAVNLLQRHMSGLRRALEPQRSGRSATSRLLWTDAGYRLALPESDLDLSVFHAEVDRAHRARATGDLSGAAEALRAGLGLWRGPALAGLSAPFLDAQREVLAEQRLTVVQERIEVELALGRHRDLIAELRHLVAEHPLRERLSALLMLALYRCDRQAEALTVYQQARQHLSEEVGVDPGAPLQQLHQQILAADTTMETVTTGPAAAALRPEPPSQLPHTIPGFIGRDQETDRLNELLAEAEAAPAATGIIAIAGTAGVGKTALAVHWAHQIQDRFPDGRLYVNLRGFDPSGSVMLPEEAIRGFLDAFAVAPQRIPVSPDAQAALYRSLLAGKRMLVVLDNARDANQVRPLLPGAPGCTVLITSRDQLSGLIAMENARSVPVGLLGTAEARELLARRLGTARTAAEPQAVDDLIDSCARLPLALAIVAARAAAHPSFGLAVIAGQLREEHAGLDAFDSEDPLTDVRAVFSWSYHTLSPQAAGLLRQLGLHPGPDCSTAAAASLAGLPLAAARRLLAELTRANLMTEHVPGRFSFHDLLRAYAAEKTHEVDSATDRQAAIHRVLDHCLQSAYAQRVELSRPEDPIVPPPPPVPGVTAVPPGGPERALSWFTGEHHVLLAAVTLAAASGFDTCAWQLAWTLKAYFFYQGHWHDQINTQRIALAAARRLDDPRGQAHSHFGLARASARLGLFDDAYLHYLHSAKLLDELDDNIGQAQVHHNMAWIFDAQGRYAEALEHVEDALERYGIAGDRTGQARAMNAVGWFHARLGNAGRALAVCGKALGMLRRLDDREGEANTWDSLGFAHHRLGHHRKAVVCYQRALDGFLALGDLYNQTDTLDRLGDAYQDCGDVESARAAWRRAQAILDALDHPDASSVRTKLLRAGAGQS